MGPPLRVEMSPNPYGNVSSRKDRAKCSDLLTRASRLHEAAESLEQSAKALEDTCSKLTAIEHLPSKSDRFWARWKIRPKAEKMEYEALEKAREALRLAESFLRP